MSLLISGLSILDSMLLFERKFSVSHTEIQRTLMWRLRRQLLFEGYAVRNRLIRRGGGRIASMAMRMSANILQLSQRRDTHLGSLYSTSIPGFVSQKNDCGNLSVSQWSDGGSPFHQNDASPPSTDEYSEH